MGTVGVKHLHLEAINWATQQQNPAAWWQRSHCSKSSSNNLNNQQRLPGRQPVIHSISEKASTGSLHRLWNWKKQIYYRLQCTTNSRLAHKEQWKSVRVQITVPQYLKNFDTVGLVVWPVKIVPEMTYNVSSGTLSLYTTTVPQKLNYRNTIVHKSLRGRWERDITFITARGPSHSCQSYHLLPPCKKSARSTFVNCRSSVADFQTHSKVQCIQNNNLSAVSLRGW